MTVAAENVEEENRGSGSFGRLARCSVVMNAAPATANTTKPVATTGDAQPDAPALDERGERRDPDELPGDVGAMRPAWQGGQMPGGKSETRSVNRHVRKNTERHPSPDTSAVPPVRDGMVHPSESDASTARAAPTPWTQRATISAPVVGLSAQPRDDRANTAMPTWKMLFAPRRSRAYRRRSAVRQRRGCRHPRSTEVRSSRCVGFVRGARR